MPATRLLRARVLKELRHPVLALFRFEGFRELREVMLCGSGRLA